MLFDFGDGRGPVEARKHANGGGMVDAESLVATNVYVDDESRVTRSVIFGNVCLRDSIIHDSTITGGDTIDRCLIEQSTLYKVGDLGRLHLLHAELVSVTGDLNIAAVSGALFRAADQDAGWRLLQKHRSAYMSSMIDKHGDTVPLVRIASVCATDLTIDSPDDFGPIPLLDNLDAMIWRCVRKHQDRLQMHIWHGALNSKNGYSPFDLDVKSGEDVVQEIEQDDHICSTSHCRAGWAIALGGREGQLLQMMFGPWMAGALIYAKNRPGELLPNFYADDGDVLKDLQCRAEATV